VRIFSRRGHGDRYNRAALPPAFRMTSENAAAN